MPGVTMAAVVMLWILFGIGASNALGTLTAFTVRQDSFAQTGGGSILTMILIASLAQVLVWTVLRGIFAVKIARRSGIARLSAIIFEVLGLGIQLIVGIAAFTVFARGAGGGGWSFDFTIGISAILPIVVICMLATHDSKRWCEQ